MGSIVSPPFLQAHRHISVGPWIISDRAENRLLSEVEPSFDAASILTLTREVKVRVAELLQACHLPPTSALRLGVSWFCDETWVRRTGSSIDLTAADDSKPLTLSVALSGIEATGATEIITRVVLAAPGKALDPLAAVHAGSILAQSSTTVRLGSESIERFPTEIVDFSQTIWAPPAAGWQIVWGSGDWELPFLSAVRICINSSHDTIRTAATREPPTPVDSIVQSAIRFDTALHLISRALRDDDFITRPDEFPPRSAGAVVRTLIRLLFEDEEMTGLRSALEQRPEHFSAELQARLGIFSQ